MALIENDLLQIINRPLSSSKNLHFQNEARCTTFLMKMSLFGTKTFMSPLPISLMYGFFWGGVDCDFKGLEALEREL